jgi:phosphatidylserine decarboxylase
MDPSFRSLDRLVLESENTLANAPSNPSGSTLDPCHSRGAGNRQFVSNTLVIAAFSAVYFLYARIVVAAADGTIIDIVELDENEILKAKTRRVGIFLSIFDVHTNRSPIDGRIIHRQHREGLCVDARRPDCSEKNESMTWAFQNRRVTIVVRQLTGAIARRIVAWAKIGDELKKGERFGMIRFGSRTEIYLPLNAELLVKVGDHVLGGSTVIARFPEAVGEADSFP